MTNNTNKKFVKLTNDKLFKETLGNPRNIRYLEDFIESYLKLKKGTLKGKLKVTYETSIPTIIYSEKTNRCDLVAVVDNDFILNLEMYTVFNDESFKKSRQYIMKISSLQLHEGDNYDDLNKVEQVNIIEKVKVEEYKLKDRLKSSKYLGAEDVKMVFYRLDFLEDVDYNEDRFMRWLRFINANTKKERQKVAEGDEIFMDLNKWLDEYANDESLREFFNDDMWNKRIYGLEGRKEGIKEGKKEKTIEIARNLKKDGIPIKTISKNTGLSIEEIEKL